MPLVLPSDLSDNQAAIWLDQQLFAGKPIYNTGQVLAIRGDLRVDLFECALREAIAESPGLRLPPRSGLVSFALTNAAANTARKSGAIPLRADPGR